MSFVVGVDAGTTGWVGVALKDSELHSCVLLERFHDLVDSFREAVAIGVDMPMGLLNEGMRRADIEAREFIGPRRNSVFMTPPRPALVAPTFGEALVICRELTGSGLSKQAYALAPRILEVDEVAARDERIHEVHPEVSFAAMAGEVLAYPKKTWTGMNIRRRLLANNGIRLPEEFATGGLVAPHDLLDAAAAAWSARRIAAHSARTIPAEPEPSPDGRSLAIWF